MGINMPGESKWSADRWTDCGEDGGLIIKPDGSVTLNDSSIDNLLLDATEPHV
ncbi:MAG: hypothetical protein QOE26_1883 [Verrucomicrobiota bacterium]|jgi:hypothetical protein